MIWNILWNYIVPTGLSLIALLLIVLIIFWIVTEISNVLLDSKEKAKRIKRIYE